MYYNSADCKKPSVYTSHVRCSTPGATTTLDCAGFLIQCSVKLRATLLSAQLGKAASLVAHATSNALSKRATPSVLDVAMTAAHASSVADSASRG